MVYKPWCCNNSANHYCVHVSCGSGEAEPSVGVTSGGGNQRETGCRLPPCSLLPPASTGPISILLWWRKGCAKEALLQALPPVAHCNKGGEECVVVDGTRGVDS